MTVRFDTTVKVPLLGTGGRFEEVAVQVTADISVVPEAVDDEGNVIELTGDMLKAVEAQAIAAAYEGESIV
jgi:hypothetical protein